MVESDRKYAETEVQEFADLFSRKITLWMHVRLISI